MPHINGPNKKDMTPAELSAEVRYIREKMHRLANFVQGLDERLRRVEIAQRAR